MLFRFVRSVSRYCVGPEDIFGQNPLRDSEFPEPGLWIRAVDPRCFFNANPDPDPAAFSMQIRTQL